MADITRSDVSTLIEEAYSQTLLQAAAEASTALTAFAPFPIPNKTTHFPVLATLPEADWVSESATDAAGVKPQSKVTWANRTMVAEEIAVIVPVHENVLDDATADVLNQIAILGGQAIGKKLDQAVIFGVDKPSSWVSPALLPAAVAASQTSEVVDGAANPDDIPGAVNQVAELVADAGWAPDTLLSSLALRYKVANLRDANGFPIFRDESFAGFRTFFNKNGAWDRDSATAVIVDSSRVRIGVRQDITVKFLDQATLGTGEDQINLAERDMVALRFKARYAYVLGTAATPMGTNKVPVGAVTPDATS
ncbi:phage major capsid protein [Nocardia sp. CA-290969]|uniref:phage major capsid protein n=1 Tax=Nocardia sp. CA-290969 TaxID=3239986 RepID=UPI003D936DDB